MLPLCGRPVLEIMLERLNKFHSNIIIATTNDGSENPIVNLCIKLGVKYYQGDTENVLSRYYEAAKKFGAKEKDLIIRCTSDCPLIDPNIIENAIIEYETGKYDFFSTGHPSCGFPFGFSAELFTFEMLEEANENAKNGFEQEHVTPYFYHSNKNRFKLGEYYNPYPDASKYRLTLDEEDDYTAIKELYKLLDCKTDFNYSELLEILIANPYIYNMNAHIHQKTFKE